MYIDRRPGKKTTPLHYIAIFIISGFLFSFTVGKILITSTIVNENTMSPTLEKGDVVFFFKLLTPKTGNIVLYTNPAQNESRGILRVAAVSNEIVELKEKQLIINSKPSPINFNIQDRRIFPENVSHRDSMPPVQIPAKSFFLIGDNFDRSYDSRFFGTVHKKNIVGVLFFKL
jgi:signal peptidase I